jgi:two-component system sensor histidine kinase YesM
MQNKRTELPVTSRRNKTLLLYNDEEFVHSNFQIEDGKKIIDIIKGHKEEVYYGKTVFEKQECFLVTVKIKPEYSKNYYTLACIGPYKEIVKDVNETTMKECLPFIMCIAIAGCLIAVFSVHFSRQINQFRETMHDAASGNFDTVRHLDGKNELSMLYEDLNVMIADIQHLMDEVVAEQVQKEKLNSRQKEVEFKMLASQINPHFLYNTLETIRMKAIVNQQLEIAELTKMLAKIMRRNIQAGKKMVTLESEIQLVEYYLKIQNYRFGDRIQSEVIVDESVNAECYIMPLIIQPLVENAFVHGLESVEMKGKLTIQVASTQNILTITVEDNGVGISQDKLKDIKEMLNDFDTLDRTHIGVCNVNQRIKLQYGEAYGMVMESQEGQGTKVMLKMPVVETDG